ncbi:hypothetical protein A2865_03815 [Candidatus Woesebacteria bacterium RIFCSPHIGHO2_01_FULL_39_17]|uniref:Cell envelope-related transcriptional attenuator n=2 Tax=Candidatus Woeseibacteriota TaxID=1752722 RepID=A0A0G0NDB1_9BACT|nr:MAG: Cell envelope-related transcriptional attenuator [Candidatus Woesebacteria bacterium GW2011_GWA1_39_21b]OGM23554.1 MAG: hypothetical protein A2865_03815 [Candidatus Woesebacteria bacterium RIFCSPHIGHO2_01_FULL_39_17]OGM62999.1 MAG: hypothetical protein A3A52_03340 [Candidatus Woesebacteria bacterium RIFCSPLOWO2_01_FULL_39_14]
MEELEEIQSSFEKEKFIPETKVDKRKISFSRLKRRVLRHVWMIRGSVIFFVILVLFLALLLIKSLVIKSGADYYLGLARDFVFTPRDKIKIFDGRTNILVLGKGDVGHEAPDLTDTMILVSVDHQSHKVNLISLPRDIWITTLRTKLNSTYYWGNKKQPPAQRASGLEGSGGMILAKSSVEEIVGQPVHYALVLDFSGFKKIIDVLGGVEVDVERSFSDEKYPIPGREDDLCNGDPEFKCRYETLNFVQGKQFMDGETALKFVRSRNAIGDQGTDFARQVRQQKVITAIKDKLLSKEILLSPKKLTKLKEALLESTQTDITPSATAILTRRSIQARDNVYSFILPEDLLLNPPKSPRYDNLYVFVPKDDNWDKVHKWIECVFENGECKLDTNDTN